MTYINFEGEVKPTRIAADIGQGTSEDAYYVYTLEFNCLLQIGPPAKVYPTTTIETIDVNIYSDNNPDEINQIDESMGELIELTTLVITSYSFRSSLVILITHYFHLIFFK